MSLHKKDDLLDVLLALEERIMRNLQVASLAQVLTIDTNKKECGVKLIPTNPKSEPMNINCKYAESLEEDLTIGSIVTVLFLNKDTRQQLKQFEINIDTTNILQVKNTHSELNGIIINVFRKKVSE